MLADDIWVLPWRWFIKQAKSMLCLRFGTRAQRENRGVKERTHKGKQDAVARREEDRRPIVPEVKDGKDLPETLGS